ncbi:MAG TPA: rod shape-determining protein MreD [Chitinophagales bacterium]|nr:rod shape-determining protein MreD [Chitinophagales bacterium]
MLLLLAQVLFFSNINFSVFINPYVFPLFILLLPFETPRWLLMLIGFFAGLMLDVFLGPTGMHAAAGLLIGYLRPFLISTITPKGAEFEISPNVYSQGPQWFAVYLGIATFIYLLFFFVVDAATLVNFFLLLLKTILSTIVSVAFMFIFLYLFSSRKKRRFA